MMRLDEPLADIRAYRPIDEEAVLRAVLGAEPGRVFTTDIRAHVTTTSTALTPMIEMG
jgi:hypothetical protein